MLAMNSIALRGRVSAALRRRVDNQPVAGGVDEQQGRVDGKARVAHQRKQFGRHSKCWGDLGIIGWATGGTDRPDWVVAVGDRLDRVYRLRGCFRKRIPVE